MRAETLPSVDDYAPSSAAKAMRPALTSRGASSMGQWPALTETRRTSTPQPSAQAWLGIRLRVGVKVGVG
eukprot:scaffold46953_cov62-Phaeocystis_antarctica.AAC.16